MNRKQLDRFKKMLQEQLDELMQGAKDMVQEMTDEKRTLPDPTDSASEELDRNFMLRIKGRERNLIIKVRQALERIDNGTFGICELCGEKIDENRLLARPITTQCIECKTEMEHTEKRLKNE